MIKSKNSKKLIVYSIAVVLIIISFCLPPTGQIDPSVLFASGILLGGWELMFGNSIKSLHIDNTGVHIETHNNED